MSAAPTVLILPGWLGSGPEHWQSHWERTHPAYRRVQQRDWERPDRAQWVAALDRAVAEVDGPVVLAAHSLGCITTVHWAAHPRWAHEHVRGALLVAAADIERTDFVAPATGFGPIPLVLLPFPSILVASSDDPYCAPARAEYFAACWGSRFVTLGPAGHINAEAGFGPWPEGEALLAALCGTQRVGDA